MLKRIFTIACGVVLGSCLAMGAARLAMAWGLFPNRELNQATNYVREVLSLVNENYVEESKTKYQDLTKAALHGMLVSLDPHSEFMEAREYQSLQEDMSSEFGGIGVQVEMRDKRVVVLSPTAGGPSERAGVLRGDEVVRIDGELVGAKISMDDIIGRLRGKPRSQVRVGFFRPGTKKEFELTLVREVIKVDSVRGVELLPGGIGYVQITQFTERTGDEFGKALKQLGSQGMRSLILDLRNNPGGLLDAAVEVAEPFFAKGDLIVYTQGRQPGKREEYRAESNASPLDLPMVVLLNAGSASAAEIVAGALKDTRKAVIVGERSFGKGSVQSIFKLNNGEGMRLTTARYYTPSGVTIHEKGVEPQVEVVMTPAEDRNIQLQRVRRDLIDPKEFKERFGAEPVQDRQLLAAVDALKGVLVLEARAKQPTSALTQ